MTTPLKIFLHCYCGMVLKTEEEKPAHARCAPLEQRQSQVLPNQSQQSSFQKLSKHGKKQACPTCGQSVNRRKIEVVADMVVAMRKVYMWCGEHRRHEFKRGEINHLLESGAQYSRFGDWVHFGGIFYKVKRGFWGLNMKRAKAFLHGESKINIAFWYDPLTKEKEYTAEATVHEVSHIQPHLNDEFMFVPEYETRGETHPDL